VSALSTHAPRGRPVGLPSLGWAYCYRRGYRHVSRANANASHRATHVDACVPRRHYPCREGSVFGLDPRICGDPPPHRYAVTRCRRDGCFQAHLAVIRLDRPMAVRRRGHVASPPGRVTPRALTTRRSGSRHPPGGMGASPPGEGSLWEGGRGSGGVGGLLPLTHPSLWNLTHRWGLSPSWLMTLSPGARHPTGSGSGGISSSTPPHRERPRSVLPGAVPSVSVSPPTAPTVGRRVGRGR